MSIFTPDSEKDITRDLAGPVLSGAPVRVQLGDDSLSTGTVALVGRAAENRFDLVIEGSAANRMDKSVALRDDLIATCRPIYGVTTGFGDSARFQISPESTSQLQRSLITYHLN